MTEANTRPRGAGQLRKLKDGYEARVRLGGDKRKGFRLHAGLSEDEADKRCNVLGEIAQRFRKAGKAQTPEAEELLKAAGEAVDDQELAGVLTVVDEECSGLLVADAPNMVPTFGDLADKWTSGKLAELYPDHVAVKRSAETDKTRLKHHILPHVKDVPLTRFTLDHADEVMRKLPADRSAATRRQVAQIVHRVLKLAVYPCRIIKASPIPPGWLPKPGKLKARTYLRPDEDRKLLGCTEVAVADRLLFGFLAREGMRTGEAVRLRWADFALDPEEDKGTVRLDENKTDDPRSWALSPGVATALRRYRERFATDSDPDDLVFLDADGDERPGDQLVKPFRRALKTAKIDRPELFEQSKARQKIRAHDLRASFVTISLANGKTETWVADRTGHADSRMINRYRRAAREVAELGLGELDPLASAIPELRQVGPQVGPGGKGGGPENESNSSESGEIVQVAQSVEQWIEKPYQDAGKTIKPRNQDRECDETARGETAVVQPMAQLSAPMVQPDAVEIALAEAIAKAAGEGRFDVLPVLVRELEARRMARQAPEVVSLEAERARRR